MALSEARCLARSLQLYCQSWLALLPAPRMSWDCQAALRGVLTWGARAGSQKEERWMHYVQLPRSMTGSRAGWQGEAIGKGQELVLGH